MNQQHYVEIKPKHCSKCGKDYTPIIHSDECPHNKVGVSEQDELLLTPEEVSKAIKAWRCSPNEGRATEQLVEIIAEALLAKAKPIIEKQERERIIKYLDGADNLKELDNKLQALQSQLEEG